MTTRCRNCRVDLSQYPLARDGFCVPSHATNDNRLEMEPDEDATRDESARGGVWVPPPPDVYGGTL
jgi:hypothetical protein